MRACTILIMAAALAVFASSLPAAESSDVAVSVATVRPAYHVGEPIAVSVSVRNRSNASFQTDFAYPRFIGIVFTCPGQANSPEQWPRYAVLDICIPIRKIPPGGEMKFVVALNRYLRFSEPGRYLVKYKSDGLIADYKVAGELAIELKPGAIDEEWIKDLALLLKKKTSLTRKVDLANQDPITKEEAIELLSWAETPAVIEPLLGVTDDLPNSTTRIVETLRKFFRQDERARKGILEFGRQGDAAFCTALRIYDEEHVAVPRDWLQSVLGSQATGMRYFALEYLRKHGAKDDVRLVEPLTNCVNPQIAALAATVAKELRDRPPMADAPAALENRTKVKDN